MDDSITMLRAFLEWLGLARARRSPAEDEQPYGLEVLCAGWVELPAGLRERVAPPS